MTKLSVDEVVLVFKEVSESLEVSFSVLQEGSIVIFTSLIKRHNLLLATTVQETHSEVVNLPAVFCTEINASGFAGKGCLGIFINDTPQFASKVISQSLELFNGSVDLSSEFFSKFLLFSDKVLGS